MAVTDAMRSWLQRQFFGSEFALQEHICLAFSHCQNSTFLPLANNEIHFPVTETCAVSLGRALMYGDAVRNECPSRGFPLVAFMPAILHLVTAMCPKFYSLICTNFQIYALVTDVNALKAKVAGDLSETSLLRVRAAGPYGQSMRVFCGLCICARASPSLSDGKVAWYICHACHCCA